MSLRALVNRFQFWKPKAERIAATKPAIPDKKIDVFGGMRLLHRIRDSLRGRIASHVKQAEERYYGSTCQSKRRGFTRRAILPSLARQQVARSRRPAKNKPHGAEKQRCFVKDPVTGSWAEKWLRPADQSAGTIRDATNDPLPQVAVAAA